MVSRPASRPFHVWTYVGGGLFDGLSDGLAPDHGSVQGSDRDGSDGEGPRDSWDGRSDHGHFCESSVVVMFCVGSA